MRPALLSVLETRQLPCRKSTVKWAQELKQAGEQRTRGATAPDTRQRWRLSEDDKPGEAGSPNTDTKVVCSDVPPAWEGQTPAQPPRRGQAVLRARGEDGPLSRSAEVSQAGVAVRPGFLGRCRVL